VLPGNARYGMLANPGGVVTLRVVAQDRDGVSSPQFRLSQDVEFVISGLESALSIPRCDERRLNLACISERRLIEHF
jgi:hypothetical protein